MYIGRLLSARNRLLITVTAQQPKVISAIKCGYTKHVTGHDNTNITWSGPYSLYETEEVHNEQPIIQTIELDNKIMDIYLDERFSSGDLMVLTVTGQITHYLCNADVSSME